MIKKLLFTRGLALAALVIILFVPGRGWGQISITSGSPTYSQNFDGLAAITGTGIAWTNNTTLAGWYLYNSAGSALTSYGAEIGGSGTTTYCSYGLSSGNTERAFGSTGSGGAYWGSPASGAVAGYMSLALTNSTGSTVNSVTISFDGEQWRKENNASSQTMIFQYGFGSSFSSVSSWTNAGSSYNFTSPITGATSAAAVNGNVAGKITGLGGAISSLGWTNGSILWVRWVETNDVGTDHALAIDNFSFSASITAANDQTSKVEAPTSQIAPGNIGSTAITSGAAVDAFKFKISDLATTDLLATKVTQVKIAKTGTAVLNTVVAGAQLFDGVTQITTGTPVITASDITFPITSSNLDVANGLSKEITLKVYLTSNVTDNSTLIFSVPQTSHGFTADATGSGFATDFGAAVTGNTMTIRVTATKLLFIQQPTSTQKDLAMTPSPTVKAVDANNNTDLDYSTTVSVTSSGTLTGSPVSGSWTSNVFTFSPLTHTVSGSGLALTAASGSITNAISSTFDISDPQPEINIQENSTNYLSASNFAFGNIVSGNSSSVKTFTIQNIGAANLTLTGTPKVAISGTNASEFTVDQTTTTSPVAASGSTTFTITFSPTSQGAKTAQISIANNDATGSENPYIINLTGTGTVSAASDIVVKPGYTYPSNIAYGSYQATDITGGANDIEIAKFTIRDGGATTDADNLGTTLNTIVFSVTNSANIRRIALYDGASEVGTEQAGAATVTFSGLALTATDGGTKDFSVRISYNTAVTDNQQTQLTVAATTSAASTGSGFAGSNAGAAVTSINGDDNRIEVVATHLGFTQQPTTTSINVAMSPAVTIAARDANNNTDLDFTYNIRVSSSGTMTGSPVSVVASSGVATFSSLVHTVVGTGLNLTAERDNSGAWDWDLASSSFNIDSFIGKRWDGGASTTKWGDAANWYPDGIPAATDNVLLNNDFVNGTYSVSLDGTTTRNAKTLQVGYDGNTNSITLQITGGSSSVDALNIGNGTGDDLIIADGGIVDNSSVVGSTGNRGIEFTNSASTWIMTGTGKYIHNQNGGSFPNSTSGDIAAPTFSNNSTFVVKNITNWINPAGLGKNKNYGNLIFDGLSATATLTNAGGLVDGETLKVNGSMQVINTSNVRLLNNTNMTTGVTIDITGSLTVDNGSYLVCSGGSGTGATISVGGSTTTTGTGFIAASQASTPASGLNTYKLKGDFNGYYKSSSKLEILRFTGNSTVANVMFTSSSDFLTLEIDKPIKLLANIPGSRIIYITSNGVMDFNGFNVIGSGDFNLLSGGSIKISDIEGINSTVANPTGNVRTTTGARNFNTGANYTFKSSFAQTTGSGLPATVNKFTIDNAAGVKLSNTALTVTGTMLINSGKLFTLESGKQLTVSGPLNNNAGLNGLVIKSDGSGSGSLIENTSGVPATVECYLTANKYHSFTPSVRGQSAAMFTSVAGLPVYLYSHKEANNADSKGGYFEITDVTTQLLPLAGYGVYVDGAHASPVQSAATFTEQGNLNTGPFGSAGNLTRTGSGLFAGFNYVGNPYPSYIDWNASSGWTKTNIAAATYVENGSNWATYTSPGPGVNNGSNLIAPGQGFFVMVSSGANGTLLMDNNVRTHTTTPYLKSSPTNFIRLVATGNGKSDETVVRFDSGATPKYDGQYDAVKFAAGDIDFPQIYSISDKNLSYNALPETNMVQLGFNAGVSGTYTIGVNAFDGMPYLTLEDTKTGIFTEILKNTYTFNYAVGENEQRFKLHFSALSIDEQETEAATIYSYQKTVYINMKETVKGDIYIYNISGQLVASKLSAKGMNEIGLPVMGNYIVKVITKESSMVKKVFIQ